jgi:excinuclease ABC subunit C
MNLKDSIKSFPESPGVYLMKNHSGEIVYIGKATSLKHRVLSYFQKDLPHKTAKQMSEVKRIDFQETDSTVEAILLESRLIKKYSPIYNIKEKDDKSRIYVHISREEFPRLYVLRETDLLEIKEKNPVLYGPFLSASSLETALELIRKIIPFRSCKKFPKKKCLYGYIGLCPAPCEGRISKEDYRKNIRMVRDFFEGKKSRVISSLNKEIKLFSKQKKFEEAAKVRDRLFALERLKQAFAIKQDNSTIFNRVEGYDISNISGVFAVGSMVVFIDGIPEKSEYRKFKIYPVKSRKAGASIGKADQKQFNRVKMGPDDVAMMRQVLERRFKHDDWDLPDLILIDGGKGQVGAAIQIIKENNLNIPVVGLAKGPDRKKDEIITSKTLPRGETTLFKQVRDEAHRFAKGYYEKLHRKEFKKA